MFKRFSLLFISILSIIISVFGIASSNWFFSNKLENSEASAINDESVPFVCYNKQTGVQYRTIEKAIKHAGTNQSIYTYVGMSYTLNETITLTDGVSLYLPIDDSGTIDSPTENADIAALPTSLSDRSASTISQYRKFCLNLRNGADIVIEQGSSLYVGGQFNTVGCTGNYTEINLGSGSSITVSGLFQCYGFVKECKDDAVNPKTNNGAVIDNTDDVNRYISVTSTGQLNTYMGITETLSGGSLATAILSKKFCPFWTFDFAGIQTYISCSANGKIFADAILKVGDNYGRGNAHIIGAENSSAMFRIASGFVNFHYVPENLVNTANTKSITYIFIDGAISLANIVITVKVNGVSQQIDTKDFFTPISYKLKVILCENSTFNVNYQVKFLNESLLEIRKNATLYVNSELIFYTVQAVTTSSTTSTSNYNHNSKDSTLINNGKIVVNSNGKLGAYIQHNSSESIGQVDFSSIGSAGLTVSAIDDSEGHSVEVSSSGLYLNESTNTIESGNFLSSQTYTAGYNSSFETPYYWNGSFSSNATINVNVEKLLSAKYAFGNYSIYTNSTQSTSGQEVVAENMDTSLSYNVPRGNYIRISAPGVQAVSINIGGTEHTYDANTWIKVNSSGTITITPSEGTKVLLYTTGLSGCYWNAEKQKKSDTTIDLGNGYGTDSGRGSTEVELLSSDTKSGTFTQVAAGAKGECTAIVKKGAYVRTHVTKWGTNNKLATVKSTKKYCIDRDGVMTSGEGFDPSSSSYQNDEYTFPTNGIDGLAFTFGFEAGGGCFIEGSKVLMADGTIKNIEDLRIGDNVMVFNHATGQLDSTFVSIDTHEKDSRINTRVMNLHFENGISTKIAVEHGFFSVDQNKYVYINESNYNSYINERFVVFDEQNQRVSTRLKSVTITEEYVRIFAPLSYKHLNLIVDNLLSISGCLTGIFNYFDLDENMMVDKVKMQADIDKYGLYEYSDWSDYLTYDQFEAFNVKYLKVSVGKGLFTEQDIINYIKWYVK